MKKKTHIIAEAGVNHNGNLKTAFKLIDKAKYCGADTVKFQSYKTEEICLEKASLSKYQRNGKFKNQFDLLKKYELNQDQIISLYKYAKKKKIEFMLSFFDTKSLEIIKKINLNYIKVPSGEISNELLLRKISKLKKKIILSTGMSNIKEIKNALKILLSNGLSKKKITLLYCISSYPTHPNEIFLPEIKNFKKKFKNLKFFIRKEKPRDLSRSCIMGFKKTNFTNILVMDGDLQHRPADINKLYKKMVNEDCDIVVGSRELTKKKNEGLRVHRLISSIILIFIVNIFLGFKTNDPMSGFFIFKKKIFLENEKKLTAKGYKILFDLIYAQKKPIKIRDIFIKFNSREEGFSKMDYKVIYLLLKDIVKKFLF